MQRPSKRGRRECNESDAGSKRRAKGSPIRVQKPAAARNANNELRVENTGFQRPVQGGNGTSNR